MHGHALPRQVLRRGAQQMVDVHQVAAHEPRWWMVGDAYGQVHGIVDQVHVAVFQPHLHIDLGVQGQELGHVRVDHGAAHGLGHADAHQAARPGIDAAARRP